MSGKVGRRGQDPAFADVRDGGLGEIQARCRAKLAELDPSSTVGRLDEYSRGGFPGGQGDGRRSAVKGLPALDMTDRLMDEYRREFYTGFAKLEQQLDRLLKVQWAVTLVYEPKPHDNAVPCSNTFCTPTPDRPHWGFLNERDIEKGFRECEKCRKHREREGQPWPHKSAPGLRGEVA